MAQYRFNPEVQRMLENFCAISGLRVGIHNLNMEILLEYPEKPQQYEKFDFCDKVWYYSSAFENRCHACDRAALETVRITKKASVYRCHAGFWEAIIPVLSGDTMICVLMIGQVRDNNHDDAPFQKILQQLNGCGLSEEQTTDLRVSFEQMERFDKKRFQGLVYFLEICAQSIFDNRLIRREIKSIAESFCEYVDANLYHPFTISQAADALDCSVSHLSKVISTQMHTTFTEYVAEQRVSIAKKLLQTTNQSVKSIAATLCYEDPAYFMRVFKRITGMTCLAYRKSRET